MSPEHASKRRRVEHHESREHSDSDTESEADGDAVHDGLRETNTPWGSINREISPPPLRKSRTVPEAVDPISEPEPKAKDADKTSPPSRKHGHDQPKSGTNTSSSTSRCIPSPISLTRIHDLPDECNIDTVRLTDILGDTLIKEVWILNYVHDIDFIVSALDADVRGSVQVNVVHGSWRREDAQRIRLEQEASRYDNVRLITAYMPEMFGTHHAKAFFIIRHDDMAQVVIHTANMIRQDWANLTQAVWRSPLLPLLKQQDGAGFDKHSDSTESRRMGSGGRFKLDILNYLRFYGNRTKTLVQQLERYDFSAIRAALVGSVPCKQRSDSEQGTKTIWGWRGLRHILESIPCHREEGDSGQPQIVIQVSSVATLGPKEKWFSSFLRTLATATVKPAAEESASGASKNATPTNDLPKLGPSHPAVALAKIAYHIVFPTPAEIRRSLDGYASGASIHMKIQSAAQKQQLQYMHPLLRHWDAGPAPNQAGRREALRRSAAPHIKTYIRFSSAKMDRIDWAMVTSANLSKQAWGELEKDGKEGGEVGISSYELGVVVWPALFNKESLENESEGHESDASETAVMVPVFGRNTPESDPSGRAAVGFRMPYDLPLEPYAAQEQPWCATAVYDEPDWAGSVWPCFE